MFRTCLVALAVVLAVPAALAQAFDWGLPEGVAPPPVPADNPMSVAKVELGRRLFNDMRLSRDQSMSCGSCHWPHAGFAENNPTHRGVDNSAGKRNSQPLANIGYISPLTWANPHATTLELQAMEPVFGEHPVEMGMAGMEGVLVERVSSDACYRLQFTEAFPENGGAISVVNIFKAIGAFQRTLNSFNSPHDRAGRGEAIEFSERAIRGRELFSGKGCQSCHSGPNFTDQKFHSIGLPVSERDRGLVEKTGREEDADKFRTPSLRNVWITGPFMHDGSISSVSESILAHTLLNGRPAPKVSEEEAGDMAMFLETLTDSTFGSNATLVRVVERCGS